MIKKSLFAILFSFLLLFLFSGCSLFVHTPFSSCVAEPSIEESEESSYLVTPAGDYPAMIMWDGVLYNRSYSVSVANTSDLVLIGETTSYTDALPTKDGETNFSRKTGLLVARYGDYLAVQSSPDGEWYLFTKKPDHSESAS